MSQAAPSIGDPHTFLAQLVDSVRSALPDAAVRGLLVVRHDRSLADRLAGRPGAVTGFRLEAFGEALSLNYLPGPRWGTEVARISGGVTISRQSPPLGDWLAIFAGRVAALAADAAGDSAASARALQTLGIQAIGSDIQVDNDNLLKDLKALPVHLSGRVPEAAIASIQRIAALLADTLPRVEGSGEAEHIVRRTATTYLPDTIRAYLALPEGWVSGHVFRDGTTPDLSFIAQLSTIEAAVKKMRDSALENDASALLVNGRFLTSKFAPSTLDL